MGKGSLDNNPRKVLFWPWSCKVGIMWCIPGTLLSAIGGVNCVKDQNDNHTVEIRDTCYFDIEGEHAELYRGLAIGLVILHVFSFIYLILSKCPIHTVLDQIKEDPRPARNTAQRSNAQQSTISVTRAATKISRPSSIRADYEQDLLTTIQRLENRITGIETGGFSGMAEPYSQ